MRLFGTRNLMGYLIMLVLPAVTLAGTSPADTATPESNHGNFSNEAANLLKKIHTDAYQTRDAAARLESYVHEPNLIDWQADADVLGQLRHWANDMDRSLSQLRTIQGTLPADQHAEIKVLAPAVVEITDNTQSALQYLNDHNADDGLFLTSQFKAYANLIYQEARRVEKATAN
jgi:hypothetical protein